MSAQNKNDDQQKHFYDGIEEHDNFLPRWWLGILYGSMIFAAGYYAYYELGPGPTLTQEYVADVQQHDAKVAAQAGAHESFTDEQYLAYVKQPAHIAAGKVVFDGKCVACHGAQGQGVIGPNMTDDYWIHGAKFADLEKTITNGVADKGMPPWGPLLKPDEIHAVIAFIRSIRGSNPPNPKAPQGEKAQIQ